ncbi:hypothetical protein [Roseibium sp. Sym1]|uniref:hypothetical protein n=1 Tax=Roseibium sp. Sym1 TaxID=3016006 RepID=UPI0022B3839D|nr:hypothetical protein [Roseibium sp. Sym1]
MTRRAALLCLLLSFWSGTALHANDPLVLSGFDAPGLTPVAQGHRALVPRVENALRNVMSTGSAHNGEGPS